MHVCGVKIMSRLLRPRIVHWSMLTALVICLTVIHSARVSTAQLNSPFLYYYSRDKAAFIIERANGSESRILASYTLHPTPGVDESIIGPGWSPSGKWFAWSSELEAGGSKGNVFLVKREGGTSRKVFSTEVGVGEMKWSP